MNYNQKKVYETALESVGGYENYINDNALEGTDDANISREDLFNYAKDDVRLECPKEVRFLGNDVIEATIYKAVDLYDYRTW